MNNNDIKWDQILRFRIIELVALWEGRLTTNHLCNAFNIGRQQASRDIAKYRALAGERVLVLDQSIKGYKPAPHFEPRFIKGTPSEYLSFIHGQHEMAECFEFFQFQHGASEIIVLPERHIQPAIIRKIVKACREGLRLDIEYMSMDSPQGEGRIITPHTIVFDGVRWHVRAHSEKNNKYRDFVLSRITEEPDIVGPSQNLRDDDLDWHTFINLTLYPNPFLTEAQQALIARDYAMTDGKLVIRIRKPLTMYYKNALNVCDDMKALKELGTQKHLTSLTVNTKKNYA